MSKLIIRMDPVMPTEIFQIKEDLEEKIAQVSPPINILKFLANNYKDNQESIEVEFVGPKDFISRWVEETKQLDFVKVSN